MRRRLAAEDGFTLPELLTTIMIGMVICFAALALLEFSVKRAGEVDQRVDATQRGRAIMDTMTRELRSQVCLNANTAAMATRAGDITDGSTATFYSDFTDDTDTTKPPAELHKLAFDSTTGTGRILDYTYATSWDKTTNPWTAVVSATPKAPGPRVIANYVAQNGTTPIFTYYAFDTAATPSPSVLLTPAAGTGLALADLKRVARIDITFRALPTRPAAAPTPSPTATPPPGSVVLQDEVYVRAADPNDDAPTPTCA